MPTVTNILCEECRRPWNESSERWRMYLTDDRPPIAIPYCPACATREFDVPDDRGPGEA